MSDINFIDLFAGIGGIRLGLEQACLELNLNSNCLFTSEIDKYACKTYEANFNSIPSGDITKIDEKEIPKHNILCGGFPCQAFSIAGLRKGFEDIRGTLFFNIARILNEKKPEVVFLENVKGLINHDGGNTFKKIISILEELGYFIKYKVLSSKNFGVPQNRQRIYIVGFLDKNKYDNFIFPDGNGKVVKVGDILEKNFSEKYLISKKLWNYHKKRKEDNIKNGKGFGFQLFTDESPYTATLSARYYKDGSEILIKVPRKHRPRMLTPRECARLQGFPDDFKIIVSDKQAYQQFGNSVSVPVIKEIFMNILKLL